MSGEPDLTGNTVDAAGSSAAQLPQKNILERKEVLIGEGCLTHSNLLPQPSSVSPFSFGFCL